MLTAYRPRHTSKILQAWSAQAVSDWALREDFMSMQSQKWLCDGSDQTVIEEKEMTDHCNSSAVEKSLQMTVPCRVQAYFILVS